MVVTLVTSAVVLSALAGLFMHYFYGGIKVQPGRCEYHRRRSVVTLRLWWLRSC